MKKLLIVFLLSSISVFGQGKLILKMKDTENRSIAYFTLVNVLNASTFIADSTGRVILPNVPGYSYKISCVGYRDTLITINTALDHLEIIRGSQNQLEDITVKGRLFSEKLKTSISDKRSEIYIPPSANNRYTQQIARIVSIDKAQALSEISFFIRSRYDLNFSDIAKINIYAIDEKLEAEISTIQSKPVGFYELGFGSDMIYTVDSQNSYITYNRKKLNFTISKTNIILDPGNYLIALQLKKGTYKGVEILYSRERNFHGIINNIDAKRPSWGVESWYGKYLNPVISYSFFPEKNK